MLEIGRPRIAEFAAVETTIFVAVGLRERVLRCRRPGIALVRGPDPLELLRHADRGDPRLPGGGLRGKVRLQQRPLGFHVAGEGLHAPFRFGVAEGEDGAGATERT